MLSGQVEVQCGRCGKPQHRHYSRATLRAICFECRAVRQKERAQAIKQRAGGCDKQRAGAVCLLGMAGNVTA